MSQARPAEHPKHLAHHFDSPQQQYASAKLGMWIFLATELLMFGGLFCAYGVFRYNHPEVFAYAHLALDPMLGGVNTVVLIASSFTMALAVRYAQLGQRTALLVCLALTIGGGVGFMGIKTIEYKAKWQHHLFPGKYNVYNAEYRGEEEKPNDLLTFDHASEEISPVHAATLPATTRSRYIDPLAGTLDEPKIKPPFAEPLPRPPPRQAGPVHPPHLTLDQLDELSRSRVNSFFSIYFLMTGLHGIHVLIGIGLIAWVLVRGYRGEFGPDYFTPVDLVGLYWHLVDLIWIFLFPLLYLIH